MSSIFWKAPRILLLVGALAVPMVPFDGKAQQPGRVTAQEFQTNPKQVLTKFPAGGAEMIAVIRDMTLADPANLPVILRLLPDANNAQGTAIGTGLGQAALASVRTNQAYATEIQKAVADKSMGFSAGVGNNIGSSKPKIGSTITTVDEVNGTTEKGTETVTTGSAVYADEVMRTGATGKAQVLLADRTNLAIAPMTEIRLDKFVYDPGGGPGNVVVVASTGAFRFITGLQPHEDYTIKTAFATMGVRGTEFIVVISSSGLQIQVISGVVVVTTISGQVVTLTAGEVLSVSSTGDAQGPTQDSQPLVNFADLGPPITNISYADALDAFTAVTGGIDTGATGAGGGGGGGGGGSINPGSTGGAGGGSITPNFTTAIVTAPNNPFQLNLTGTPSTPGNTPNPSTPVSVH